MMTIFRRVKQILKNHKKMKFQTALNILIKQKEQIKNKNHSMTKLKSKHKVN